MKKIAAIGDVHGLVDEFGQLIRKLEWQSLDEIWHLGDLVDRGPDSAGVIQLCIDKNIRGVMGNHDQSILNHKKRWLEEAVLPSNPEKKNTLTQLSTHHFTYLESLPNLHVFDDLGLVLVHGGLWPSIPLYAQPLNVIRAQLIHPDMPGKVRWWGKDAEQHTSGKTEEQSKKEGFDRWYNFYDHEQHVIYGHSSWYQPKIVGKTIGIDTGSCFGGSVTACIFDSNQEYYFLSIKAKEMYCKSTTRVFWEE